MKELILSKLDVSAAILVVVGALNWGLVAVAHFDLVAAIFGMKFGDVRCSAELCTGLLLWQASTKPRVSKAFNVGGMVNRLFSVRDSCVGFSEK